MKSLYESMEKRKSIRKYDPDLSVSPAEMAQIESFLKELRSITQAKVAFRIVPRRLTTAKWGEYCLLAYSEKQEEAWLDVGYQLEQVDLFLASLDIGACWYGMSRPDEKRHDGLDYVIMLAFGKCRPGDFRQSPDEAKRKETAEIWAGDFDSAVSNLVRYAPSACNAQPWRVVSEGDTLRIYRTTAYRSIIPRFKKAFLNSIDLGIFLLFLELSLDRQGYAFTHQLTLGTAPEEQKLFPIAVYTVTK